MKILFAVILLVMSTVASATGLELSVGKTARTHEGSAAIGLHTTIWNHRVHFGYAYMGTQNFGLMATPAETADDIAAGNGPGPYYWFKPHSDSEWYLTVDQQLYTKNAWHAGVTVGLGLYHPQWQQELSATGWEKTYPHSGRTNGTPIFGAYVGSGSVDLVAQVQWITGRGDWEDGYPPSMRETVYLRYSF